MKEEGDDLFGDMEEVGLFAASFITYSCASFIDDDGPTTKSHRSS
jgi:hypothetical protein